VTETLDVYAGYCTTRFTTARGRDSGEPDQRLHRGRVVAVRKPDDTVLVHDADGYQPVAWLTRPSEVWVDETPTTPCGDPETSGDQSVTASAEPPDTDAADGVELVAIDGDERLTVRFDPEPAVTRHVVTAAGAPAGDCHCGGELVTTSGEVHCLDCAASYAVPRGGQVVDATCEACGLPELSVERGEQFRVCLDRDCQPLAAAVASALDGRVDCPDCGAPLRVEDHRGRQFLGCDDYPACETAFSIPAGVIVGSCACGLPVFDRGTDRRCLDAACSHDGPTSETTDGPVIGTESVSETTDTDVAEGTTDDTGEDAAETGDDTEETTAETGDDTEETTAETETGDDTEEATAETGDGNE